MASERFQYDLASRRFRDGDSGRYLSRSTVRNLRDAYLDGAKETTAALSEALAAKNLTLRQWERGMRAVIRDSHVGAAALGGGGRGAMTQSDWGKVGAQLKNQYEFLGNFAQQVGAGELSEAQVTARAGLYVDAAVQGFERAKVARIGELDLPAMPGDGGTPCLGRCLCEWEITSQDDGLHASWQRQGSDSCDGCIERAERYASLVFPKEEEEEERRIPIFSRNGTR